MAPGPEFDHTSNNKYPKKQENENPNSNDPILNPRNPYYLHHGENPSATIVAPPLDDNNYHNWSKFMRRALTSKKVAFINGNLLQPSTCDHNYELRDCANKMVPSWRNHTLSPYIAQNIICFDSTYDLW